MKLSSKGQVTTPADLRRRYGFVEGDDVEVTADGKGLRIIHVWSGGSRGTQLVERMRGRVVTNSTTDELMALLRSG